MHGFIGIDLETTGLEPSEGHILEIGVVLFNEHLEPDTMASLVGPDVEGVRKVHARDLDPYVRNMHRESGLLDELDRIELEDDADTVTLDDLVNVLEEWSERLGGKQPMLGSSVHFDRAWLKLHFPEVERCFSYRNIDASSFWEYARTVNAAKCDKVLSRRKRRSNHRAVEDVLASAETIKLLSAETWIA